MTTPGYTLSEIRAAIDAVDRDLVGLLARREHLVRQAATLKTDMHAVRSPDRVEQVISKVRALAAEAGADQDLIERIYRAMIQSFVDMETDEHHRLTRRDT